MRLTHRRTLRTHHTNTHTDPPLVELVDLTLEPHLHHLDLSVHPGEHIALVGLADPTVLTGLLTGTTRPNAGHLRTPHPAHLRALDPTSVLITANGHRALLRAMHHPTGTRTAHRVLYLEQGRLTETGTHRQLLLRGGRYARTYALTGPHRST